MSPSREERRQATDVRILEAARATFGERGYERATIREIAAAARVDPALVMQRFGSKHELFLAAVRAAPDPAFAGGSDELVDFLVQTLALKLADTSQTAMPVLRSMLTHPEATAQAREAIGGQATQIAAAIGSDDAELRAAVVATTMLGLRIGRELLELDALREADGEQVAELLRDAFASLTGAQPGTGQPGPA